MRADTSIHERCVAIARMILGADVPEEEIAEFASYIDHATATMPPPSPEQRDAIAVLLRP